MVEAKKKLEKNRIHVSIDAGVVEVESSTESLDKVYAVLNDAIIRIGRGRIEHVKRRKDIAASAIG